MNDINQRKEDFKMKIVAVGLGLIGGSMCKAIKKHTNHLVGGIDIDRKTVKMALSQNAIDYEAKDVSEADVTIVSLFPPTIISFIKENADLFKEGSIVIDTGGIKKAIVDEVTPILAERGVTFIGVHPMAGREFSIHFKKVVKTTPEEHDRIIAFTSQLAHVVSNAYIKSPTHQQQLGFSAGSFQDLTRVAKLNEDMWTPLFIMNKEPLCFEIDYIMARLAEYRDAIANEDHDRLRQLLRDGRILKETTPVD